MRQPPLLDAFGSWLSRFGDAWEGTDEEAMAALFAPGASMQPTPFAELIRGRPRIGEHWAAAFSGAGGVQFRAQVLGAGDTYGVAHFRVSYAVEALATTRIRDGVLLVALDERGLCTSLRTWWHEAEE